MAKGGHLPGRPGCPPRLPNVLSESDVRARPMPCRALKTGLINTWVITAMSVRPLRFVLFSDLSPTLPPARWPMRMNWDFDFFPSTFACAFFSAYWVS
eukprot:6173345-Pleurochrysis_carterae.AAC.1